MVVENISTLKIHKLSQEQYDRALAAGEIDSNALYLTPYKNSDLGNSLQVDNELSATSINPVQNRVVYAAINDLDQLIGDKSVSTQIDEAIGGLATKKYVDGMFERYIDDVASLVGGGAL